MVIPDSESQLVGKSGRVLEDLHILQEIGLDASSLAIDAVEQLPVVLHLGLAPWLVEPLPDRLSLARIAHIGVVVGYLVVIVMKTEPFKLNSSTRRLS